MNYFVTGTDTDVGKTFFTALYTRALRRAGFDTLALKPICCGQRDDVQALWEASDREVTPEIINPLWFTEPAAPLVAARHEGREIDLAKFTPWFTALRRSRRSLLIEGAGGWLVPITSRETVADLAVRFSLPVLVVVANKLGCLNHARLTVEHIRSSGLTCAGLVLNNLTSDADLVRSTNRQVLEETCGVPVLFELSPGQTSLELGVA